MPRSFMLHLVILFAFYTSLSESVKVESDMQRVCKKLDIFYSANGTSWREAQLTGDVDNYQVTVCRTGKKVLIQPLNYLWFSNINYDYNHLTNKFYTTFVVQLTSSRILDEMSKRPEFNSTQVSFMDVSQVRFVAALPDFHQLRKDIKLNENWMTPDTSEENEKYVLLQFRADSRKSAAEIASPQDLTEAERWNAMKATVQVEIKTTQDSKIMRTNLKRPHPQLNITTIKYSSKKRLESMTAGGLNLILMQRRETAGVDFNKNWFEYKNGFGDWRNDFWLGLEKIYQITKDGGYGLRMEFESHTGLQRSAQWVNFRVGSEEEKYKLIISGFDTTSSAGYDGMYRSNGGRFATVDKVDSSSCAERYGGGWWFTGWCMNCHFNNELRSRIGDSGSCVNYLDFNGSTRSSHECLKRVRMFIIKH